MTNTSLKNTLRILQRRDVQRTLFSCVAIWLCVTGATLFILPQPQIDLPLNFYLAALHFIFFATFATFYYKTYEIFPHHASFKKQILLVGLFSAFVFSFCLLINYFFPLSEMVVQRIATAKFYFPLFRLETCAFKFADITFQQVMIYGALKKLKEQNLSNHDALLIFGAAFFVIHIPLIYNLGWYAFYFIVPSLIAGGLFSYLILFKRYGLFKSFATHFLFYIVIGLYLRS